MSSEMKATSAASWVQTQLTNFFQSGDDEAQANVVLQQIFAPNCEVRKDHTPQDLAAFETDLLGRKGASEVTWGDVISTEGSGDEQLHHAIVAGTFVVKYVRKWRIRAAPAESFTDVCFSARIERALDGQTWKITSFDYTFLDRAAPIHLAVPTHATEEHKD